MRIEDWSSIYKGCEDGLCLFSHVFRSYRKVQSVDSELSLPLLNTDSFEGNVSGVMEAGAMKSHPTARERREQSKCDQNVSLKS